MWTTDIPETTMSPWSAIYELTSTHLIGNDSVVEAGPVQRAPCTRYCDMPRWLVVDISWWIEIVIMPAVTIFGLIGNVSSMIVLVRQGLIKSSNILLMALTVADFALLIGINEVLNRYLNFYRSDHFLDRDESLALFIGGRIQTCIHIGGFCMSIWYTAMITMERCVAVYLPLKFNSIIRPRRTRIAIVVVCLVALVRLVFETLRISFYYHPAGFPLKPTSDFALRNQEFYEYFNTFVKYAFGFIPICTLLAGSVLIGLRVSYAAQKRARMMSAGAGKPEEKGSKPSPSATSRTTKTLLTLCILCSLTLGTSFFIQSVWPPSQTYLYFLLSTRGTHLLHVINSSSNFLIYVFMNKNFRDTYIEIFAPACCKPANTKPSKLARTSSGLL